MIYNIHVTKNDVLTRIFLVCYTFFLLSLGGCQNNEKPAAKEQGKKENVSAPRADTVKHILFFGNSLTAGLGVDLSEAFPALIQKKIDSLKLPYRVINAGLSGETTAGGKNRIDWLLKQKIDVFVLELGANDGLRGIPVSETSKNLKEITDRVKAKYPDAKQLLLGMEVPPNMGGKYTAEFRLIFKQLAAKDNIAFVPFLLEGVGGVRELNQGDGIHPTAEGHKILAENVWRVMEGIL